MKKRHDSANADDRLSMNLKWSIAKYEAEVLAEKIDSTTKIDQVNGDRLSEIIKQLDLLIAAQNKYEA